MERTALCIFLIFSIESFITSGSPLGNLFDGKHNIPLAGWMKKHLNNTSKYKLNSGNMIEFDRQIRTEIKSDFTVAPATEEIRYDPEIEMQEINREKSLRNRDAPFTPMIPLDANFIIPKSFLPEIPEDCLEAGFCDTVPNYPEEYFTWIIETYYLDFVMENKKPYKKNTQQNEPQYLCNVTSKYMTPKAIASSDGNWYFVLNSNKLPLQTLELQQCNPTNTRDCAKDVLTPQQQYASKCEQLSFGQKLIVLESTGRLRTKNLPIPSGCYCALSENY